MNRPISRREHKYNEYKMSQYENAYLYQVTPKQHLMFNSWKSQVTLMLSWK